MSRPVSIEAGGTAPLTARGPQINTLEAPVFSLVIPTYNEAQNIPLLLDQLTRVLSETPHEIWVVDDDSPDKTWLVAEKFAETHPSVKVLRRREERGLSSAVVRGFELSSGRFLGVMDADLSHDASILPKLIEAVEAGADIAVGSRRVPGGGAENWPWHRRLYSHMATYLARLALGITLRDPMSGYFVARRQTFERSRARLQPRGYKILLELVVKANARSVVEVPFVFKDRQQGYSKLSAGVATNYLWQIMTLVGDRWGRGPSS